MNHRDESSWFTRMNHHDESWWLIKMSHDDSSWWIMIVYSDESSWFIIMKHNDSSLWSTMRPCKGVRCICCNGHHDMFLRRHFAVVAWFCQGTHCIVHTFWLPWHLSMLRCSKWDNVTAKWQHTNQPRDHPPNLQNTVLGDWTSQQSNMCASQHARDR